MGLIQSIKDQDAVPFFEKELGPACSKSAGKTFFRSHDNDKTPSLCVYPAGGGYYDYAKGEGGSIIDFVAKKRQVSIGQAIEELRFFFNLPKDDTVEKKTEYVKHETLYMNFERFRLQGINGHFAKWLTIRGVSREDQQEYHDRLKEIAREIGYHEAIFENGEYNPILIFPCTNEHGEILGGKIRRIDGQLFFGKKSKAITGGKTGVIHSPNLNQAIKETKTAIICEGEPDYVILRMMGFENVIGNLGGVGSCMSVITKFTANAERIVSFYDGDEAGQNANSKLSERTGRPVRAIEYPKIDGKDKVDVNDLFKLGYRENDFISLIERVNTSDDTIQATDTKHVTTTVKIAEDTHITEKDGGYQIEKQTKDGPKQVKITNFILRRVELCVEDLPDGFHRQYSIMEMELDGIKTKSEFHSQHTSNLQSFASKIKEVNQNASRFCMTATDLEAMFRYIAQQSGNMPVTKKYDRIGYIPTDNVWILRNGIMKDGKFNEYTDNIAEMGNIRAMVKRPQKAPVFISDKYYNPNIRMEICDIFSYIFCGEAQGSVVLGWLTATMFIQTVYFDLFPYLFTTGEPGSGKTTALRFAMSCFGRDKEGENFSETSRFIETKNICESGSVALWRDEFENPTRFEKNDKTGLLKSLAMRTPIEKGKADQTSVWYNPTATMMLSGQVSPTNAAIFERCCMVYLKKDRKGDDTYKNKAKSLMGVCPSVFRWIMEHIDVQRDAEAFKKILANVSEELSAFGVEKRMNDVFTPVIAGYVFWKERIEGEKSPDWDFFFDMINSKQIDEQEDNAIDSFFEVIFDEMDTGKIISFNNGSAYIRETNEGSIFIAVSGLYAVYSQNMKITDGEKIPKKTLKKYLMMSYNGEKHRTNSREGIAIPKNKAPRKLLDILDKQSKFTNTLFND